MGSWFSNLHVRKTDKVTNEDVYACVKKILADRKYTPVENLLDADVTVAIVETPNSQWISICSEVFAHDDPDSCKGVVMPFSSQLHTDVLGISCFDSDYLYLNLINAGETADAWVGIGAGKEIGITRRNNLTAWKKKVLDYPAFSASAKEQYACADEFLSKAECSLGLSMEQADISLDYLQNSPLQEDAMYMYFRQEEETCRKGPQLQIHGIQYTDPCFDGVENSVPFINMGDAFYGLSVYFVGPYVEHDEITFSNVKVERFQQPSIELTLKKVKLPDGQWAYFCHDPEILFPEGIPRRMTPQKRHDLILKRMRKISFVPNGNKRKMLDITVVLVPDGNSENRATWNIWQEYGSKEEFINQHNKLWKRLRSFLGSNDECLPLLKLEDFDE